VFISWENEAYLLEKEFGGKVDVVYPSLSIVAEANLKYLYTDEAQDIAGKHYYRPVSAKAQAKYASRFPKLALVTIDGAFGGWDKASRTHFADGGVFDQIYTQR
jgi:sulfate/thiosulfate transport system substrate-binding protein